MSTDCYGGVALYYKDWYTKVCKVLSWAPTTVLQARSFAKLYAESKVYYLFTL